MAITMRLKLTLLSVVRYASIDDNNCYGVE